MEAFEIHGHGKASEVPCQDCGGTGKELGRWTQDPKQNFHQGWDHWGHKVIIALWEACCYQRQEIYGTHWWSYNMETSGKFCFLRESSRDKVVI